MRSSLNGANLLKQTASGIDGTPELRFAMIVGRTRLPQEQIHLQKMMKSEHFILPIDINGCEPISGRGSLQLGSSP